MEERKIVSDIADFKGFVLLPLLLQVLLFEKPSSFAAA
jgi:hypothetical protein